MTLRLPTTNPRRASREPVVPMINVVFLLLIFFLMTAQIAPPAPFDIALPSSQGDGDEMRATLYVSAAGEIAFGELRGPSALERSARAEAPLRLVADAGLDAAVLARVLGDLAALGATRIELVTEGR
ncbi:biopolymer transporter ExbD [Marivita sp. GX14005]|uniref:ExbD/TolR family protein n=1 Tax=Marivita sp. GX14005 TaxID=2942276 RepID=UPI002019ADDB|nr:biopolymer transporter ExbD [Marivita sp. GX14005]MCL3882319.1 biopolymer transporter ExbD [Marivita sp. GX14005]